MLKKGDIIIIISVLALITASSALLFFGKESGRTVTVKENNEVVYKGSLYENKVIELEGNILTFKLITVNTRNYAYPLFIPRQRIRLKMVFLYTDPFINRQLNRNNIL